MFKILEVKLSFSLNILHFKKVLFKQTMMATLWINTSLFLAETVFETCLILITIKA